MSPKHSSLAVLDEPVKELDLDTPFGEGLCSEFARHISAPYGQLSCSSAALNDVVEIRGRITVSF